jgi:hypothetical protein
MLPSRLGWLQGVTYPGRNVANGAN